MVYLRVVGVTFAYQSIEALRDVELEVDEGELVGVVGPNGAGKTTLLKTVAGVLKPKVGAVYIGEREVAEMSPREVAKKVGVVPQEPTTYFGFTVFDVVMMGRNPHLGRLSLESQRDYEVVRKALEATNTLHLANRRITELSGGERQRVFIARALAQEPKVLLLDEPVANLDIAYQLETMQLLRKLVDGGIAALAVSHDLNLVSRFCDKVVMLKDGRVVAAGSSGEVLTVENIRRVFGVDVAVRRHPTTNALYVIPLKPVKRFRKVGKRVHVVCGGGSGEPVLHELVERGYDVSAGVLNVLDTDYQVCQDLGIEVVSEAPFSPISEEAVKRNLEAMASADILVLVPTPFGQGNLKNLQALVETAERGKPVVILGNRWGERWDFTGGRATELLRKLKSLGARTVSSVDELESL